MFDNPSLLKIIRAKKAMDLISNRELAQKCNVSQSQMSQFLRGEQKMPERIARIIVHELGIEPVVERLTAWANLICGNQ